MGFNYLQTDDRDDYLSQFGRNREKKRPIGYTLISPAGEKVFESEPMFRLRSYCKKKYLPFGKGGKHIWRETLLSKGYQVITVYPETKK